jgi:hypothetical protein
VLNHQSEQTSRIAIDSADLVMTFREWCHLRRFSVSTGRRLIDSGNGPQVTRLSERRIGITVGADRKWLAARSAAAE